MLEAVDMADAEVGYLEDEAIAAEKRSGFRRVAATIAMVIQERRRESGSGRGDGWREIQKSQIQ